jgi:methionyl-tRNA formyltransferase
MKIIFFGTPQFAVPCLEQLIDHPEVELGGVVTQPDKRRGRGQQVSPSPVKTLALETGCPIWQPSRLKKAPEVLEQLQATQADAFVVVAYGQILSPEILGMPRLGCINAHGSLLPLYRGAAPIQWSLYHGETTTGITTMQMDAGMDTGPMLLKETIPIHLLDNAWDIAGKLAGLSGKLVIETLQQLEQQRLAPIPQDDQQATYAPLIQKSDYDLDWGRSALAIHNQVRGFYPNCSTQYLGNGLKVTETLPLGSAFWERLGPEWAALKQSYAVLDLPASFPPGSVVGLLKNYGPVITTGDGHLLLRTVKPSGKQAQSGWDFVNGSRLQVGSQLG